MTSKVSGLISPSAQMPMTVPPLSSVQMLSALSGMTSTVPLDPLRVRSSVWTTRASA